MPLILGYWNIRGLGQPIRLLMQYVGEEYKDKLYHSGPAPEYSSEEWLSEKFNLGLAFPNLPYLIDGNFRLTETKAILKYIGQKHNLVGQTAEEMATVNMLMDVQTDYNTAASRVFYNPSFNDLKADLMNVTEENFQKLENYGKGKKWFVGDKITVADFLLYEYIKKMMAFHEVLQNKFSWIKEFVANFEALPAIKKYMASTEFQPSQFNGDKAVWGGK